MHYRDKQDNNGVIEPCCTSRLQAEEKKAEEYETDDSG